MINKLLNYKNLSNEVKATIWYTICNVLIKGISFITVPLFTRILSESDYGIVNVYNGWRDIFLIFCTLNLYNAVYNNAIVKYKDKVNSVTSSMIMLIDVISVIALIIYSSNRHLWSLVFELTNVQFFMIFVELFTIPAYFFWMAKQRFSYKYKSVVIVTLFVSILAPLLSYILIKNSSTNLASAKIIGTALPTVIVGIGLSIFFLVKGKVLVKLEYWFYAIKFSIPLIPHYLSGIILNQSDRIMISRLVSDAKAGIYSVAYNASFTISLFTSAINNSLIPWMYKQMEKEDYLSISKRTTKLLIFFSLLLSCFVLVIPELMIILAPPSYYEAKYILPVLVLSVYFQFLYGFFGTIEFYFEKTFYVMCASVMAALVNIITNLIFIPIYGYLVAAYTTLICYIIMSCSHYIFLNLVLKKKQIQAKIFNIKQIAIVSLSLIIIVTIESLMYDSIILRYSSAVLIASGIILNKKRVIKLIKE